MSERESGPIQIVRTAFDWCSAAITSGAAIRREDVARFFTEDAVMITNDVVKCDGLDAHVKHFTEMAAKMESMHISPFHALVQEGERAAGYYRISFKDKSGGAGTVLDMAFWEFRDGKIAKMTEIVEFVGARIELNPIDADEEHRDEHQPLSLV